MAAKLVKQCLSANFVKKSLKYGNKFTKTTIKIKCLIMFLFIFFELTFLTAFIKSLILSLFNVKI